MKFEIQLFVAQMRQKKLHQKSKAYVYDNPKRIKFYQVQIKDEKSE